MNKADYRGESKLALTDAEEKGYRRGLLRVAEWRFTPEVARRLLAIRDMLAEKDINGAYHELYAIANPKFDKLEPFAELESIVREEAERSKDFCCIHGDAGKCCEHGNHESY